MRENIEFKANGITLRGWLYTPDNDIGPFATIVMAHGFSAVKEMYLDAYADVFSTAGFAVLVYDNRNLGASDGEPRQEIDPWQQIQDYRDAITYASSLPQVDERRIGIWGSSYSGAHVLVVSALDRRVRCVVSQVPLISGSRNMRRLIRADMLTPTRALFDADRRQRYAGGAPAMIPVVCEDPLQPCALPTADSWQWMTSTAASRAPAWRNEVTLRSVEMFSEYEPGVYIPAISPTPLLMVVAREDHLTVADEALSAFNQALEPKKLALLPGGHFDAYVAGFAQSSGAARDWFIQHL